MKLHHLCWHVLAFFCLAAPSMATSLPPAPLLPPSGHSLFINPSAGILEIRLFFNGTNAPGTIYSLSSIPAGVTVNTVETYFDVSYLASDTAYLVTAVSRSVDGEESAPYVIGPIRGNGQELITVPSLSGVLRKGDTHSLNAVANTTQAGPLRYRSLYPHVCHVSQDGQLVALDKGECVIEVTHDWIGLDWPKAVGGRTFMITGYDTQVGGVSVDSTLTLLADGPITAVNEALLLGLAVDADAQAIAAAKSALGVGAHVPQMSDAGFLYLRPSEHLIHWHNDLGVQIHLQKVVLQPRIGFDPSHAVLRGMMDRFSLITEANDIRADERLLEPHLSSVHGIGDVMFDWIFYYPYRGNRHTYSFQFGSILALVDINAVFTLSPSIPNAMGDLVLTPIREAGAERLSLSVLQDNQSTRVIDPDGGLITVSLHNNGLPVLPDVPINWLNGDAIVYTPSLHGSQILIDPNTITDVTQIGIAVEYVGGAMTYVRTSIRPLGRDEILDDDTDTNGNLTSDAREGWNDLNANGVPDYADGGWADHVLALASGNPTRLLVCDFGLSCGLGPLAMTRAATPEVALERINAQYHLAGLPFAPLTANGWDVDISNLAGQGSVARVVFALAVPLPAQAAVYHVNSAKTAWALWGGEHADGVESAQSLGGVCPTETRSVWRDGLHEGDDCIRLTLQDGASQDTDGATDSMIRVLATLVDLSQPVSVSSASSSSAASVSSASSAQSSVLSSASSSAASVVSSASSQTSAASSVSSQASSASSVVSSISSAASSSSSKGGGGGGSSGTWLMLLMAALAAGRIRRH